MTRDVYLNLSQHYLAAPDWGNKRERRRDANSGYLCGVLIWNDESGEGEVLLHRNFKARGSDITALDALNDWCVLLGKEIGAAYKRPGCCQWKEPANDE